MAKTTDTPAERQTTLVTLYDRCIRLAMLATSAVLVAKIGWLNDVALTLRDDPLDLWIASGVALLLAHSASRRGAGS
jgi:hypothetical protein